jgi:hypothetical protein
VAIFGAAKVFAAVLGPSVRARADGAGRGFVGASLVGVSESVAVAAVSGGVRGVDRGDISDAGKERNCGAYDQGLLFGNRNNDGGGSLLGSNLGVGLKVAGGGDGDVRGEVDG